MAATTTPTVEPNSIFNVDRAGFSEAANNAKITPAIDTAPAPSDQPVAIQKAAPRVVVANAPAAARAANPWSTWSVRADVLLTRFIASMPSTLSLAVTRE